MSWAIFVYTVVPSGAMLVAMLASGKKIPMWAACKVLSTPVRCGNIQYSAGAVMTAFCLALSYLSHLGLRGSEARVQDNATGPGAALYDQQMRDVFCWGRNFYMSLLGLALWSLAWRLKVLHDAHQLHSPGAYGRRRHVVTRIIFLALGIASLLLADIPLCRVNYNLHLATFVTPKKNSLMKVAHSCEGIMAQTAGGQCADFCQNVRKLSEERLHSIQFARNWHVLGRWAAELFDDTRGMKQGAGRIDALFEKRSCGEVLRSVDKSNQMVNYLCITFAGVSLMGAFTFFASVLHEHTEVHDHRD